MIFRVENGCFGYKEKQILKNISFTVRGRGGAFRPGF